MQTVAIVGVGLIGGSFALALRQAGFTGRILGVSSPQTLDKALRAAVIDAGVTLEEAAAQADLIYLSQPINGILDTIERLAPIVRPGTFVTDAGSTKSEIVAQASRFLPVNAFLGGHPMAGKETRGVEVADPDLFRSRPYVLTPVIEQTLNTPAAREFVSWIEKVGANTLVLPAGEHDRMVAFVSHLPQLASTALAAIIAREFRHTAGALPSGPGLADMTRLALSPFEIWHDILVTNRTAIGHALQVYIDKLTDFRENLTTSALSREFDVAAEGAAKARGKR
jgi:prephenate dehydrogenase